MMVKAMTRAMTILALLLLASPVWAQEMLEFDPNDPAVKQGHEIMKAINDLPVMEKVYIEAELRIYDKQDNLLFTKKFRSAQYFEDFQNPDDRLQRSINYFYAPADDQGNGAMNFEHPDSDDDEQYLYLRQTRKARRIIGSAKKDDYFGSDFSLADVVRRRYPDYNFRYLGDDTVEFKGREIAVKKILSQHKDPQKVQDWGEGKSVLWVHPASGLVFKAERYNTQMQLEKVMTLEAFTKATNKNGKPVYLVAALQMRNVNRGTRSVFVVRDRRYENEAGFSTDIYTTDSFTKQWW